MRFFCVLLLAFLDAGSAQAAPADWTSYLCRYNVQSLGSAISDPKGGEQRAQLVKVNAKQLRVMMNRE